MDIGAPEGTKVMAGLTGTVTTSAYNDSYGNYVIIKDSKGYELRYAHLSSRSVSAGASVTKGDEIGHTGIPVKINRCCKHLQVAFCIVVGTGRDKSNGRADRNGYNFCL